MATGDPEIIGDPLDRLRSGAIEKEAETARYWPFGVILLFCHGEQFSCQGRLTVQRVPLVGNLLPERVGPTSDNVAQFDSLIDELPGRNLENHLHGRRFEA